MRPITSFGSTKPTRPLVVAAAVCAHDQSRAQSVLCGLRLFVNHVVPSLRANAGVKPHPAVGDRPAHVELAADDLRRVDLDAVDDHRARHEAALALLVEEGLE
jgi:hypothetical protein